MPFKFNPFTDKLDIVDVTAIPPGVLTSLEGDDGIIVPPNGAGVVFTKTAVVAAGTTPIKTVGNALAFTETWQIQISQAIAATDATKIGLSNFNSAHFSVDANGFVSSTQVDLHITPFIVSASGASVGASYTTIQAAVNAVNTSGSPGVVYIQPGTYTENLTLFDGVQLWGANQNQVTIIGTHTLPTTGTVSFKYLKLQNSGDIFNSAAAGTTTLNFENISYKLTANGYLLNLVNWDGIINCNLVISQSSFNDGFINNTSTLSTITVYNSVVGNGNLVSLTLSGGSFFYSKINCPSSLSGSFAISNSICLDTLSISNCLGQIENSIIRTTPNDCITVNGNSVLLNVYDCTLETVGGDIFSGVAGGISAINVVALTEPQSTTITGGLPIFYKIFESGNVYFQNISFDRGSTFLSTNGQLWIGKTGNNPQVGTLTSPNSTISIGYSSPNITLDVNGSKVGQTITGNTGGALSPTAGNWNIFGASTVAGSTPVTTSGAVSTLTVNVQTSQAIAATDATKIGLAAFNSAQFTVDANGFVSSLGAGFPWIDQGTSTTLAINHGYFATAAVTLTLPASPSQGDVVKIICDTASTVVLTANTGQTIRQGTIVSSSAGTFTNTLRGDALELIYRAATTQWIALNGNGTWVAA